MTLKALVFDVDGTLADTEEVHRCAFNAAFARAGLDWVWSREKYRELLETTGGKERIARYIGSLDVAAAEREALLGRVRALHADKTTLYGGVIASGSVPLRPGIARLLREAQSAGLRLAIATTTTLDNVVELLYATLGESGVGYFDVIACGDQVAAKKPAPDIYELTLRRLDLLPSQAVAFEDSGNGLRSARAAGLRTVLTPNFWTEGADFSDADLLLPHLGDPTHPIDGEPGGRLRRDPWLTLAELNDWFAPSTGGGTAHTEFGAMMAKVMA